MLPGETLHARKYRKTKSQKDETGRFRHGICAEIVDNVSGLRQRKSCNKKGSFVRRPFPRFDDLFRFSLIGILIVVQTLGVSVDG
jgi:hypothetical protein